jgi:type IV secretion system protein TrbD
VTLRRVPIHKAGIRPHLLLGADRELVLVTGLVALTLSVATMNLLSALLGIGLWFLALYGLRLMAKADPKLRDVYLRARRYRNYYPPRSTPWRSTAKPFQRKGGY